MTQLSAAAFRKRIPFMIAATAGTFVLGLVLNAYYQAGVYKEELSRNATIGAFIAPESKVPVEVVKERLINLDGVAGVQFIPKEQVLERALSADPAIKEVMLTGENPFVPYFVLGPAKTGAGFMQALVEQVRKVEGIEDVRYDANLAAVTEQLARFRTLYRTAFQGVAAASLLIVICRLVVRLSAKKLDASRYLSLLVTGLASSIAGTFLYYLFGTQAAQSALVQMPDRYLAYLMLAGVALTFVCEND